MLGATDVAHDRQLDIIGHSAYYEARGSAFLMMQKKNEGQGPAR